jgi:hypothetical protein
MSTANRTMRLAVVVWQRNKAFVLGTNAQAAKLKAFLACQAKILMLRYFSSFKYLVRRMINNRQSAEHGGYYIDR